MNKISNTSERLKQILKEKNWTQAKLVHLTGISKSAISQYLSNRNEPKQDNIYKMSKALNVNEAWLMGYDVAKERNVLSIFNQDNKEQSDEITILNRGMKKMTEEQQKKLLEVAKIMFKEEFSDNNE